MGHLEVKDAGFDVGVNVRLTKRDKKTGRVLEKREGHNRCLKMQLMSIIKYLNGEFNTSSPIMGDAGDPLYYDWIPRYLGVGTNTATMGSTTASVTTEVTVNDTRLLSEISPRVKLPDRHSIVNRSGQNYIQLVIDTYLPSEYYNDEIIAEAGLFSNATGNNCLFRITFDGISKDEDSVIQVTWTISVISIDSQNEPYEEVDKSGLREIMDRSLDKFGELYSSLTQICNDFKTTGLATLVKSDASQDEVDVATELLNQDYNVLVESGVTGEGVLTQEQYDTALNTAKEIEGSEEDTNTP